MRQLDSEAIRIYTDLNGLLLPSMTLLARAHLSLLPLLLPSTIYPLILLIPIVCNIYNGCRSSRTALALNTRISNNGSSYTVSTYLLDLLRRLTLPALTLGISFLPTSCVRR